MWVKFAAGAGILALAALFGWLYGNARYHAGAVDERDKWQQRQLIEIGKLADVRVAAEHRTTVAITDFATRMAGRAPIVLQSHDTVTRYAETPAGRAPCLAVERVHGIDGLDLSLFPTAAPAIGGNRTLPTDTRAPSAGR